MQLKETIGVLINPLANKKRTDTIIARVSSALSQRQIPFISFTAWPPEINTYKEVWLIGGDGTLNYFLNLYKEISIPIVIFKGGTGNDFAATLYGDINVDQQIDKVLGIQPKRVDAAECNGKKFINGVGIGFDGEVLRSINAIRLLGGHLGYLWVVFKKIFSFKERFCQITYDGQDLSGRFLLVMITNSPRTGGGFRVSPKAEINDGKLNLILCHTLPVLKRLRYLPVIEKGKHLDKDFIFHKEISEIKIVCEKETLAQIDGELISGKIFDIKVLPQHYLFKY